MKKLFLSALFLIAFSGLASATLISPCAVLMLPNSTGNTGSTCSATPDAGDVITSLTITITDDYTGYQSGSPVVSYSGTLTQSTTEFTGPTFCNVTTNGSNNSVSCLATINPNATVSGLSLTGYSINLSNAGNSVAGGAVTGASEVMTLAYTEAPSGAAPEPATLGLIGGGLLALGAFARKRSARV